MSVKYLDRYLEELEWRYNNRKNRIIFRDALARIMNLGRWSSASWSPRWSQHIVLVP